MRDALPFILALLFIVAQPILDGPWLARFRAEIDPADIDGVINPAKWVADVAQFLPSASLSVVGVALLLPEDESNANVIGFVGASLILVLIMYIAVSTRGRPAKSHTSPYSALQIVLFLLNVAGLIYLWKYR
jgi:hypothetical protein